MIALLQRVASARVSCAGETVGEIGPGVLVLACAERGDTPRQAARLAERIVNLRMFADQDGRMNRSVREVGGGVLLVSQFTLVADTRSGNRPSFTPAADPEAGQRLFDELVRAVSAAHAPVATGRFGAHMQVSLVNDGPVTFWLRVDPERAG
ncbi:MAG: D-tyrosyl-tRNA(Tyr) deacylase [Burkholderiales bacterium]|nr:D-tyrosyl-tRNA(Tyr) deacylase [Burkholderiales bacterium]